MRQTTYCSKTQTLVPKESNSLDLDNVLNMFTTITGPWKVETMNV